MEKDNNSNYSIAALALEDDIINQFGNQINENNQKNSQI